MWRTITDDRKFRPSESELHRCTMSEISLRVSTQDAVSRWNRH